MELIKQNSEFILKCNYEDRMIPKMNGFRWNPTNRYWYTTDVLTATKLSKYANEQTLLLLTNNIEERKEAIKESSLDACEVDIDIPIKTGQSYLPYQKAGIAYALKRTNVLIADLPGLGKTLMSIGIINYKTEINKILVICPASLKLNWRNEFNKFMSRDLSIGIVDKEFPQTDIVIMNYDILKKWKIELNEIKWDILIGDEIHYCKSSDALRTKYLLGGMIKDEETGKKKKVHPIQATRRVFLTGTPIMNRPIEMWPIIKAIDPDGLGSNWYHFVTEYCDGHQTKYGWDVKGNSNLDKLSQLLRSSFMLRRTKEQVLKDLPPKKRSVVIIPADKNVAKIIDMEKQTFETQKERIKKIKEKVKEATISGEDEYNVTIEELNDCQVSDFSELSKLRHDTAIAKVPLVMEHIINAAESEPLIIFAHHTDVIKSIVKGLKENKIVCESIIGGDPVEKRQKVVDDFQAKKIQVVVLSIKAAGVGLTLTASSHVIFVELDWSPSWMTQCEDRSHRLGQSNSVFIEHLVLDGSLDVYMANMIIAKQEIMDKALDNKTDGITTDINKLQAQAVIPEEMELFNNVTKKEEKQNNVFDEAPF